MSRHWPGWRTLPGIEIAPLAEKAREQGEPVKHYSHVWGPDERYVTTCGWQVDADGTVSIPWDPNWEPVVEDGMLTGFRGKRNGTIEKLIQLSALVVPEGEPPMTPMLTIRLPPEQIGMYRVGDSMADGIDVETGGEVSASIGVSFMSADGSLTSAIWTITPESAASVIALIRDRHGEPTHEFTADQGHTEALHEASLAALEANTIFTSARDSEGREPR